MVHYFIETNQKESTGETQECCKLLAIIDDRYFWSMEWSGNAPLSETTIKDFSAGFISTGIREKCDSLTKLEASELKTELGSFAYYIERAISGFKSYILWISPDPKVSEISWQFR